VPRTFVSVRPKCAWSIAVLAAGISLAQQSVLHIKVLAGDGVQYAGGAHAKPLTVEVTDATGRPIAGARVSFQVPAEGASGVFAKGLQTDIAVTDSNGHATEHGLQLNRIPGSFSIRITAAKEQSRAGIIARESISGQNQPESADRKTPPPAGKEPDAAPAPEHATKPAPPVTVPGTSAIGPVKVAAHQPDAPAASARAANEPAHGIPTIIVTQKSSKAVTEIGPNTGHKTHKKWIWIGLAAAGGAGAAFADRSLGGAGTHGASTGATTPGGLPTGSISIGTPTITIGKP